MKTYIKPAITFLFSVSLVLFLALGIIIVMVQMIGIITLNKNITEGIYEALKLWAIRTSIVTAFTGFIMSYMNSKKNP